MNGYIILVKKVIRKIRCKRSPPWSSSAKCHPFEGKKIRKERNPEMNKPRKKRSEGGKYIGRQTYLD